MRGRSAYQNFPPLQRIPMKQIILTAVAVISMAFAANAQDKPNSKISAQIKTRQSEKIFTFGYDQASNTSKLMAVSENFSSSEAKGAGIQAMNFAVGFYYPGETLAKSPDPILLTFWVLTKKPRFGADHSLTVVTGEEMLVQGSARYVSKPKQNMEYLNFEISREALSKIAAQSEVRFKLGESEFTFTRQHLKVFADLLEVSNTQL